MKPTRTCNWPPRLDVVLRADIHASGPRQRASRAWRAIHPCLRGVARARWAGRPAKQRRFEHMSPPPIA
jgi:hypothetical protein